MLFLTCKKEFTYYNEIWDSRLSTQRKVCVCQLITAPKEGVPPLGGDTWANVIYGIKGTHAPSGTTHIEALNSCAWQLERIFSLRRCHFSTLLWLPIFWWIKVKKYMKSISFLSIGLSFIYHNTIKENVHVCAKWHFKIFQPEVWNSSYSHYHRHLV